MQELTRSPQSKCLYPGVGFRAVAAPANNGERPPTLGSTSRFSGETVQGRHHRLAVVESGHATASRAFHNRIAEAWRSSEAGGSPGGLLYVQENIGVNRCPEAWCHPKRQLPP